VSWGHLGGLFDGGARRSRLDLTDIRWLIVGGESGPGARPLQVEWALELAQECDRNGTAFFMKQLGTVLARRAGANDPKRANLDLFPAGLKRREMPTAS
jgi:protein gp37